jgi:hypothetical protein
MDIKKAEKVARIMRDREQLKEFFDRFETIKDIGIGPKVYVSFDFVSENGQILPQNAVLTANVCLPCLKAELDAIETELANL